MISVSSIDFLLIYMITQADDRAVAHDHHDVANDDIFSFVENTFGVITATRSLHFFFSDFSPYTPLPG